MNLKESIRNLTSRQKTLALWVIIVFGLLFITSQKNNNMTDISTANKVAALPIVLDDKNGDYISGEIDTPLKVARAFVEDNSKSNPTYILLASNSAFIIGDIESAGFLLYAGLIRAAYDKERFNLSEGEDSKSVVAYWSFLSDRIGSVLNLEILREPKRFERIARMIERWDVMPDEDAFYPKDQFGEMVVAKEDLPVVAQKQKQWFMDNFFDKFSKLLDDPKYSEALNFVNDYTLGKMERDAETEKIYIEKLKILSQGLSENGMHP